MRRRSFLALASGLLVPWERERVYSFLRPMVTPTLRIYDDANRLLSQVEFPNGFRWSGTDQAADATGVASWARFYDEHGDPVGRDVAVADPRGRSRGGPCLFFNSRAIGAGYGIVIPDATPLLMT